MECWIADLVNEHAYDLYDQWLDDYVNICCILYYPPSNTTKMTVMSKERLRNFKLCCVIGIQTTNTPSSMACCWNVCKQYGSASSNFCLTLSKEREKIWREYIRAFSPILLVDTELLKALKLNEKSAVKHAMVNLSFRSTGIAEVVYSKWKWDSESHNRSICLSEQ